jgi:hypothetical protein|tara:strand:+ start:1161 stop:2867 length:1707 start_codon:yes stop_codon:yes gene_type:complete
MADDFSVNGLLDKILGGEPSSVAGFVDSDKYNSQKSFDRLLGGASGYNQAVNSGSGIATTLLNTLKSAQEGGRQTDNIYLNALKGQQQLTKGMLDVQKIQADLTKLGFENADLARLNAQTKQILIEAYLNGDTETIKQIQLLGGKEFGKRLYPETEKTPYGVTQFKQLIKRFPKEQQPKLILEYINAASPKEKFDIQEKMLAMYKDLPVLAKKLQIPDSSLDVVNNLTNTKTLPKNIQTQNQIGQNIPSLEIGIPSTGLNPAPDVETYQVGGYNTLPVNNNVSVNNQQLTQEQPVVSEQNQPETKSTISENFVTNTLGKTFSLSDITVPTVDDNGLIGKRAPTETVLQKWANDKPNQTRIAKLAIDDMNGLSRDIDALLHSKGFEEYFSRGGALIGELSTDAIATKNLYNRIISSTALKRLVKMKLDSPNGATPFGQLNYSELVMVKEDITETKVGGNAQNARTGLSTLVNALNRDAQESLLYYDTIYGKNSSKDFNYIYSPNVDVGNGTIENAISGYNLRYQLGDRASGIKDQYFYIPNQESGEWEFINNPKTKKPLTRQDYKRRNF